MFKKLVFSTLLCFGLHSFANESSADVPVQEIAEMAEMAEDVGGFSGAVELKYKNALDKESGAGDFKYRVRAGWTGSINQAVSWGIGVTSKIEEDFSGYIPKAIAWEQAYVKYSPIENFWVKAGKSRKYSNPSCTGVLYDDDLYEEGVTAKFKADVGGDTKVYVKAGTVYNAGNDQESFAGGHADLSGPFEAGWLVKGKVGVKSEWDAATVKAGIGVESDALVDKGDKTFGKAYVSGGLDDVAGSGVGAGVFAVGGTDVDGFKDWSYTAGVYVGSEKAEEANDYSAAVSYYNVNEKSWNTGQVDTDYIAAADGDGVAVRLQYNVWDNVSVVGKYAHDLDEKQSFVGEFTFGF